MKAEEIRKMPIQYADGAFLREIAAQMVELNEPVVVNEEAKRPWVWLSYQEKPFVVDSREVTGVAPTVAGVMIGMRGQPWSKCADGSVAEVCAKLGIPMESSYGEK